MRPAPTPTRPSPRLLRLLSSDLPDHQLEGEVGGWARFVSAEGEAIEVGARVQRRFLGRTEVAVFAVTYPVPIGDFGITVTHQGRMKRTGLSTRSRFGDAVADEVAAALGADRDLATAALTLDFTRFDVDGGESGCRATIELVGASHVGIAFPPIRSYVRLYPDQRHALLATFDELGRVLRRNCPAR